MTQTNDLARIYLASRSPRRAELLQQLGVGFVILPSDVDETVFANEAAVDYVLRLAQTKATVCYEQAGLQKLPLMPVLAADTTVVIDGEILGKPENDADAYRMLAKMSGRWHEVHTGLAIASASGVAVAISTTRVEMAALSDATIRAYIASGEPRDKAGAYGIQGLAGTMIKRIEGSYSGVMGLPVFETAAFLKNIGINVL
jgi:septum formation protein